MKNLFLLSFLFFSFHLNAQYYYKDLVSVRETNRTMKTYLDNKVVSVTAAGYDPQGVKTNDFSEVKEVLQNGAILKTITRNDSEITVVVSKFDSQERLLTEIDSSSGLKSEINYTYDASGKVSSVSNVTKDTSDQINSTETHEWFYNANGVPEKMLQIINKTDSTEFKFHSDEKGNVIDEQSFRKGVAGEMIYYYYDNNNRMTDIVRYNERLKKLLPDYMFEYDDSNHVLQKLTTLSNLHLGYLIWRYAYNENGLKTKEALYDRNKEMTGKIEYTYTFAQ